MKTTAPTLTTGTFLGRTSFAWLWKALPTSSSTSSSSIASSWITGMFTTCVGQLIPISNGGQITQHRIICHMKSKTLSYLLAGYRTVPSPLFPMKTWTWRKNVRESTRMKKQATFYECETCPRWVELVLNFLCVTQSQSTHTAVVLLLTRHTGEPSYPPSTDSALECLLERLLWVTQRIH